MPTPLRVLFVEDSEDDAELIAMALQRYGYQVTWKRVETEATMREALEDSWDIVISDHSMPHFSAPDALRIMRQTDLDLPFIIVSGSIEEDAAVKAMQSGAHDYILKDNIKRLIPAIEREIREAHVRYERRVTTTALQDSEERLRAVVDTAADGIITVDEYGVIETFNRAAESIFGYAASEVIGQNVKILMGEPDRSLHDEYLYHYRRTGEKHIIGIGREVIGRRKDGTLFPLDLALSEVWLHERRIFTGIVRDITERKRAEAELLQAELLRVQINKEREVIELKERFISMISHEFRTPLSVITLSTEILLNYHHRLSEDDQRKQAIKIQQQTILMTEMMEDVLLLSRARAGKLECKPTWLQLEHICRAFFEQIKLTDNEQHNIMFRYKGAATAWLDEKLLQHILLNLLSNAVKYTPDGKAIWLEVRNQPEEVLFQVVDQGIGIPAEDQPHMFEPFSRATNTGRIPGTGLGLAIVKDSVDAHGGTIEFISQQGEGTTFIVRLPNKHYSE